MEALDTNTKMNGIRKINIGLRVSPEHKSKLAEEAVERGFNVSEHVENKLLNYDNIVKEREADRKEIRKQNDLISEQTELVKELRDYCIKLTSDFLVVKKEKGILNDQLKLNEDKHLLEITNITKLQKDTLTVKLIEQHDLGGDFFKSLGLF